MDGKNRGVFGKGSGGEAADLATSLRGYVRGARLSYVSDAEISVGTTGESSYVRSDDDSYTIEWSGLKNALLSASGAGGLDTGSEAADTGYFVFIIAKSSDVGEGVNRWVYYDEGTAAMTVIAYSSASSWSDADCSEFMPPTSRLCDIQYKFQKNTSDGNHDGAIRTKGSAEADLSIDGKTCMSIPISTAMGSFRAHVLTAPVGADIKIQIAYGASADALSDMWSESGPDNRITIDDGEYKSGFHAGENPGSWGLFRIDIDQVGSGTAGADLTVVFETDNGAQETTKIGIMPTDENQTLEYKGTNGSNRNHIYFRGYMECL